MKQWKVEVASSETHTSGVPASARTVWHVRLRGGNGEIVLSSETYATRTGAQRAASRLVEAAKAGFTIKEQQR